MKERMRTIEAGSYFFKPSHNSFLRDSLIGCDEVLGSSIDL